MLDDPLVRGIVVTAREVTSRLDSEAGFRAMLAHSYDIISVLDPDTHVRWTSAATTRLLGYPSGETGPELPFIESCIPKTFPSYGRGSTKYWPLRPAMTARSWRGCEPPTDRGTASR